MSTKSVEIYCFSNIIITFRFSTFIQLLLFLNYILHYTVVVVYSRPEQTTRIITLRGHCFKWACYVYYITFRRACCSGTSDLFKCFSLSNDFKNARREMRLMKSTSTSSIVVDVIRIAHSIIILDAHAVARDFVRFNDLNNNCMIIYTQPRRSQGPFRE